MRFISLHSSSSPLRVISLIHSLISRVSTLADTFPMRSIAISRVSVVTISGGRYLSIYLSVYSLLFIPSSHSLSLSHVKLRNLVYAFCLWFCGLQAVELQKLILAHNSIESLKEDIRNLPCLAVLNLCHNRLSELPAAIGEWVLTTFSFFSYRRGSTYS